MQVFPHNPGELPDEVTLKDYESERILPVAQFGAGIETRDSLALSATCYVTRNRYYKTRDALIAAAEGTRLQVHVLTTDMSRC